jgi:hypothetical protein
MNEYSPTLLPELEPLFNREIMKDPKLKMLPNEKGNEKSLEILPFEPKLKDYVRATFELKHEDLDKIKQRVLSTWEISDKRESKPQNLSSFVLTCAYSLVCIAKAIHKVENDKEKFAFAFGVDCRARLEPPLPNNYFGNCVSGQFIDTQPLDFIKEDGVFLVAKSIYERINTINEKGALERDINNVCDKFSCLSREGFEVMGVAGSNRFCVYEIDFGWGRPEKVEIVSIDRGLTIGLAKRNDGIEIGVVLNKHVMDHFSTLFLEGLCTNN